MERLWSVLVGDEFEAEFFKLPREVQDERHWQWRGRSSVLDLILVVRGSTRSAGRGMPT